MSIDISMLKKGDKTFTHAHSDGSKLTTFALSLMFRSLAYKLVPTETVKISPKLAVKIMESGLIDRNRLEQLMFVNDPTPVTFLRGVEGFTSIVLVDGAHRYCAARAMGSSGILAKIVPISVWSKFVVTGIPDTVAGMDALMKRLKGQVNG